MLQALFEFVWETIFEGIITGFLFMTGRLLTGSRDERLCEAVGLLFWIVMSLMAFSYYYAYHHWLS